MFDIDKPVTNPGLVKALDKLKEDNSPENNNAVINEVMEAKFLTPVQIKPEPKINEDGSAMLSEGTQMAFGSIEDQDHNLYYLAFTDWEELKKWNDEENQQTVALTFEDMAGLIEDNSFFSGFVINPFGHSLPFNKDVINNLIEQKIAMGNPKPVDKKIVEKDTQVQIGEPIEQPEKLLAAIKNYLKTDNRVSNAYLNLMVKENKDESYLIVIDIDEEDNKDDIFKHIAHVARPHLEKYPLDMITSKYDLAQSVIEETQPFYSK